MEGMLKVRNWEKWQTYRKDRGQPPWIKLHRCLMRDANWVSLGCQQRGQLVAMWLLAADRDGVIPDDPTLVRKLCFMDEDPDLNLFIEKEFFEYDANMTPERRQHDAPDKNREEKKRKGNGANAPTKDNLIWDIGVGLGINRGLLGKLVKNHGKEAVAEQLGRMAVTKPVDPGPYLVKALSNSESAFDPTDYAL